MNNTPKALVSVCFSGIIPLKTVLTAASVECTARDTPNFQADPNYYATLERDPSHVRIN